MAKRVQVGKIDLDTCGTAFLLGVTREDEVKVVRGDASPQDLADPSVICIEVGGSGRVDQNNWDHHAAGGPQDSATLQAWWSLGQDAAMAKLAQWAGWDVYASHAAIGALRSELRLVEYIHLLDTQGPEALRRRTGGDVVFPTLSDCFAGMLLLTAREPSVEQLHKGVELLQSVLEAGQDPFGTICGFDSYAEAKRVNNAQIAKAVEMAQWTTTQAGRKLGYMEADLFGAPGALSGVGAEIVVVFNPTFGNPPAPKFTIAGNGIKVDAALPELNALEQGWGGPATGTILGSPRGGSSLTLKEVVEIVKKTC